MRADSTEMEASSSGRMPTCSNVRDGTVGLNEADDVPMTLVRSNPRWVSELSERRRVESTSSISTSSSPYTADAGDRSMPDPSPPQLTTKRRQASWLSLTSLQLARSSNRCRS